MSKNVKIKICKVIIRLREMDLQYQLDRRLHRPEFAWAAVEPPRHASPS
jgi:hypothetical protein